MRYPLLILCVLPIQGASLHALLLAQESQVAEVFADPASVKLEGPDSRFSLLIHAKTVDGRSVDLTRAAQYKSTAPAIFRVSQHGLIGGVADGRGILKISVVGRVLQVPVEVSQSNALKNFNFENDIIPIFNKFGCNSSGCHGKAEGQNGFKLSVFGFDPKADFAALTQEARGRRVFPTVPPRSLLLTKASGGIPHGGGIRIRKNSGEYKTIAGWIAAGMPFGDTSDPKVVSIEVTPNERRMGMKSRQQLRVVATVSDGRRIDVTQHAKFQSNNEGLGTVDQLGLVTVGEHPGEVAVMAGYMGAVDVFRGLIPGPALERDYPTTPQNNFIDTLVNSKLQKLNIVPNGTCSDAEFLRRAYLDVIGTLPSSVEARDFLDEKRSDRRARLVDTLLERPEYADYWTLKWADLLRVDRLALGHKGAYKYYRWIRDSFSANKPLDQFARDLITAEGPLEEAPAGQFYRVAGNPGARAAMVSQVFLGVRIECAQCHHHPYDRWSQTDYYGMQAFFAQIDFKKIPQGESILASKNPKTIHPRTNQEIYAHALAAKMPDRSPAGDRRKLLADWMTAPDNAWTAQFIDISR